MSIIKVFPTQSFSVSSVNGFKISMHEFNLIYMNAAVFPFFICSVSYAIGEPIIIWAELEFARRKRQDFVVCEVSSCEVVKDGSNRFKIGLKLAGVRTSI